MPLAILSTAKAQTIFTLNGLSTFGSRGDGSVQPGDSIGISPVTGNDVQISAPFVSPNSYGVQPNDPSGQSITNIVGTTTNVTVLPNATNGFNMRGLAYDPVSGNLVFVDTHTGSGGQGNVTITTPTSTNVTSGPIPTNAAIYILDSNTGTIKGVLNTNGIFGGSLGAFITAGVADDGVVYVANQFNKSAGTLRIYRWATADTNDANFNLAPIIAFSNSAPNFERLALTMAVRGAGTNTQILIGSADPVKTGPANAGPGTNVFLFTTADGTNFVHHRLYVPGLTNAVFNDGIAFGVGNTFWAKEVGAPLYFMAFDPASFTNDTASTNPCSIIASYAASSASGSDPLLNLSAITVDNARHLLAGLEEIGGTATGGRGKVWLYDLYDPSNRAPAILTSRTYIPNFQKATAPMGYLTFGNGRLYANVVNNGLLASTVDAVSLSAPVYQLPPDFSGGQPRLTDLPPTNRVAAGQTAHFEVFATPDVTNYQWYTNNVLVNGANSYFLDLPNAQSANSDTIFKVFASNAAGSTESVNSRLLVVSPGDFFHLNPLWSRTANNVPLSDPTNYITTAASGTPNERCIAYNALSNQLLIVRGPGTFANLRIFVVNPDDGSFLYVLKTNGIASTPTLNLCGIGVADDGAVYATSVNSAAAGDQSLKVYRWADSGSNTLPVLIFGTNSSAHSANPVGDLTGSTTFRFGDNLAVRGAGNDTEIILDSQNNTTYAGILRPIPDGTMTNWTQTGYLLQNVAGSYGFQAYGTGIGRGLQFGPIQPSPFGGNLPTFWQKRYNAAGAPLAGMSYNPGGGLAALNIAGFSLPLFTNGSAGINFTLNLAAAIEFGGTVGNNLNVGDYLDFYDVTDPSQAIYLGRQPLPGANTLNTHLANGNAIAQVIFGENPATGVNYVFAIQGNNGIAAFTLSGGVVPPPRILAQPKNTRVLQGGTFSMNIVADQVVSIQWYKGTNSPVFTGVNGAGFTVTNAQLSAGGDYFAIATNLNGAVTSQVAHVSVGLPDDYRTLAQAWVANPTNTAFPYVSTNGGANTPNERSFAYNALSNQLIVVKCPPSSTAYTLSVVDATSGSLLYTLDTTGIIHEGPSEVSGQNPIDLVAAAAADDGAIYICSESPNSSGGSTGDPTKMMHIYCWSNTAPTTSPVLIYEGDPSGQPAGINVRWGDVLTARGSGTNTQIFMDSQDGAYGALLSPTNAITSGFTNLSFFSSAGAGSIGRSVQFGPTNTVFQKRKGAAAFFSSYNTNSQSSAVLSAVDSSSTLGGAAVDLVHSLAIGVDFVGTTTSPQKSDAVALYDISDPATPLLLNRYNFPINQVPNNNFICQTIIAGSRVFSLDANNGLMAFYINPSVNSMRLSIAPSGANVNLSWGNPEAILQGTPTLNPSTWTDLTMLGQTNSVQPATGPNQFYRLIVRR